MLTRSQRWQKRGLDLLLSSLVLVAVAPVLLICWLAAAMSTRSSGIFMQERVGFQGRRFHLLKLRTMRQIGAISTSVTVHGDPRITRTGRFLRKSKMDELPQLLNVLQGYMSLVGPRPDVVGFADRLTGEDRDILLVRPGITGPASIKYKGEERILATVEDPESYNAEIIWPDKVRLNLKYVREYSLWKDIKYIAQTVIG